ncbi:MAG TPA: transglycosylase domain-containing protein [Candidatus Paceibacterota bacterium]|nr:transglycosylase domain-containing protein [Candidatus Paceibacterota bacterium]HRZ34227.1 transglycosylase domain-containing protein [Candidatus Paceibacterota bacterium]
MLKTRQVARNSKIKNLVKLAAVGFLVAAGIIFIWISTLDLPNLANFEERKVAQSTKILDRTGEIVLYDIHGDIKRTIIPLGEISSYLQKATIAIEDKDFYEHSGIQISAIIRAVFSNLSQGDLLSGQGGSTITQQVIKNALLTTDKKISRKIKEWVLAPRLEKILTKDQILEIYLNEIPYGGNVYGAEEASLKFFGKQAKDLSLVESAYLAALPQAPTYFSPYGTHTDALEARKNYVLEQMRNQGYINQTELETAQSAKVEFEKQEEFGIKAPHFVMYVRELLEEKFGKDVIEEGGLRVVTTLDWDLQKKAEEIVKKYSLENAEKYSAENGAMVATDPSTGEILVMVGSRDYFDEEIDGNFNIATAKRQPGSAFKPIVYAEAFTKGYRPETVVFDVSTEFSTACKNGGSCYRPSDYDGKFRGPISLRNALAQSLNIPAVKVLYLAGLRDSLNLAKKMGIQTLTNVDQYGLTLVLGGGEVRLIDITSAYEVFANEGNKYEQEAVLRVEDKNGNVLFENKNNEPERVLSENVARMISDILSDNAARAPIFGSNSPLNVPGVAVKTGTTDDYRDAWIIGYTPNISVGAWVGNNDNSPIDKRVAGFIVGPMWNEYMQFILQERSNAQFNKPEKQSLDVKPIINGFWKGEKTKVLTDDNGNEQVVVTGKGDGIHSILYWVDKSNPLGPAPSNPYDDPQYEEWEKAVRSWVRENNISDNVKVSDPQKITTPKLEITNLTNNASYLTNHPLVIIVAMSDGRLLRSGEVFLNDQKIGDINVETMSFMFIPEENSFIKDRNELRVEALDEVGNAFKAEVDFRIN